MRPLLVVALVSLGCARSTSAAGGTAKAPAGHDLGAGNLSDGGVATGDASDGSVGSAGGGGGRSGGGSVGGSDMASVTSSTGGVACGAMTCRTDESCVNGTCVFACTGSNVPGDYATVQAAIDALEAAGGAQTICLAAQTYREKVTIKGLANLTLVGRSPSQSRLDGVTVTVGANGGATVLRDFTAAALNITSDGNFASAPTQPVTVARFVVTGAANVANGDGPLTVAFDGVDLSGGLTLAASNRAFSASIVNSYIHGATTCVQVYSDGTLPTAIQLVNDTVVGCVTGIAMQSSAAGECQADVVYQNDVIAGHKMVGVSLGVWDPSHISSANNAYYGNGNNFGGYASAGKNAVEADCALDGQDPPAPRPGSPCRGAGNAATAPSHDFWDAPRGASVDIGAVQTR